MAIHSSGENGNKNASKGISDFLFGDASKDTPLWKYGILKSITWARALYIITKTRTELFLFYFLLSLRGGGVSKNRKRVKLNILNVLFLLLFGTPKFVVFITIEVETKTKKTKKKNKAEVSIQAEQKTDVCLKIRGKCITGGEIKIWMNKAACLRLFIVEIIERENINETPTHWNASTRCSMAKQIGFDLLGNA